MLQFYAVMAQDLRDLALPGRQLADDIVRQQLGAFAQCGKRGLQLVRYLLQKAVFLLLEIDQPLPHPLQALPQILEVLRTADRDRSGELATAQFAYCGIDLPDRAPDQDREPSHQKDHPRNQRQPLPQHDAPRVRGDFAHRFNLAIDQFAAFRRYRLGAMGQLEVLADLRLQRHRRDCRVGQRVEYLLLGLDDRLEIGTLFGVERQGLKLVHRL